MLRITLAAPGDIDGVGRRWRGLEAVSTGSFFQSWSWVGCQFAARYPDPLLLVAERNGEALALALFNRTRVVTGDILWLGESGDPGLDTVFTEHNGPLVATGAPPSLPGALFDHLHAAPFRRVVWSGIDDALAARAWTRPGTIRRQADRPAPYVDFAPIRAAGQDFEASLSSNARYQLRRSLRRFAETGSVSITAASDVPEALAWLDVMAALHQKTWEGRGQPGAFANPFFRVFHAELIARALPRGEVELLRIAAGEEVVGYLYNFLWQGWSFSYQSGFVYPDGDTNRKPGITCHHLAIARHFAAGGAGYDFLAGDARYKTSLANATRRLSWLETGPVWRPTALAARIRAVLEKYRS